MSQLRSTAVTRISVDEYPAGYWLDIACAQAIGYAGDDVHEFNFLQKPLYRNYQPFKPSTDIAIADQLIDRLARDGYLVAVYYGPSSNGNRARVEMVAFDSERCGINSEAQTRPLAITRAFLKARGVEYIEIQDKD